MRTALIGLGMVAGTYAKALTDTAGNITLKGVFARSPESRKAFITDHAPKAIEYTSIEEIAADDELDFVIVATPPNARAEIVQTLAKAGKPILMEKPVERTLSNAQELCLICEKSDVPLGIVFQHRKRPAAMQFKSMIEAGDFGGLRMAEISIPWWRPQSYYDEPGRGTYARDGGGVMISQAIHTMDLALSLTGPVDSVIAMATQSGLHQMESEDFVTAGLRFANGAVGQLFATTAAYPGRGDCIVLHFDKVAVTLEGNALQLAWQDGRCETLGEQAATGGGADPMAFTHDWHKAVIEDFAQSLAQGRAPMVTAREALGVHALIEAITQSAKTGQQMKVSL